MIGRAAKPLLLPLSPGSRIDLSPGPASCDADPAAENPSAHEDTGPAAAQRPEETAPRSSSSSPTLHTSSQLNRWSRARALRSGRRPSRAALSALLAKSPPSPSLAEKDESSAAGEDDYDNDACLAERDAASGKAIYMVSDGTGWTAEHSVNAALGQFEHYLVDHRCAVSTHLFSGVYDVDKLIEIIKQAAKEKALVLYTIADPSMVEATKKACDFWGIPSTDVLRPTVEAIASHIGIAPSGIPRSSPSRQGRLTEDYFQRVDAIDFTIRQDDGAQPQNLNRAHIVLVGVSRTGKTPLSIYLAQKGYKVANVPIVMGMDLPKALFEIDQDKIFGLTINPSVLQAIRKTRAKTAFNGHQSNYAEMEHVRRELDHANRIFSQNPGWPVIEITGKAIEETAAVVMRIHHDRKQKCSMPRISKRY